MGVEMTSTVGGEQPVPGGRRRKTHSIRTPLDRYIEAVAIRLGGSKAKDLERFIKFAVVGIIGAIVDFGTLNLLIHTVLQPVDASGNELGILIPVGNGILFDNAAIATTIAFMAAVASNFVWNRLWTYPDSRSRSLRRQLGQFALVSLVGWLARLVWMKWSYMKIAALIAGTTTVTDLSTVNLGTNIAQLIAVCVVMIWNFFVNRYWTYNDVDRAAHHSH
jgi:putative flippase GtrA